jgi:5-methylcytosine-specific restriction endonuclease McrA
MEEEMARSIEEIRKAKREYMAKKRSENPDLSREYSRKYHKQNKEKQTKKMREYYERRFFWGRAIKLRGEGKATTKDLAFLWKNQKGLCALTGRRLNKKNAQLDHIVAKARGGLDEKTNLRWVCKEINLAKRELSDKEFIELCSEFMRWIGQRIQMVENVANG